MKNVLKRLIALLLAVTMSAGLVQPEVWAAEVCSDDEQSAADACIESADVLEGAAVKEEAETNDEEEDQIKNNAETGSVVSVEDGLDSETEELSVENSVQLMEVNTLSLITQPEDVIIIENKTVRFCVEAQGSDLTYRWQISKDNGETWKNTPVTAVQYSIKALMERNGWKFRCVVTDGDGNSVTSNEVTLTVQPAVSITSQPEDVTIIENKTARFCVEAQGSNLSYRWQISKDDGETWKNTPTTAEQYVIKALMERNGWKFRCVVTDSEGNSLVSDAVTLTVESVLTITENPEDYYGFEGDSVVFTVKANGSGLTYQWQQSSDGGETWWNHNTATAVTERYVTTLSASADGRYVRCVITDDYGNSVISDPAVMMIGTDKATGFIVRDGKTKYRYEDGSYANGLVTIEDDLYYFVSKNLQTGFFTIDGKRYYFDDETGKAITGLKYVERLGNTYYFQGADGVYCGLLEMEDGIRCFGETYGIMQTGWKTVDGKKYYFDPDTGLAVQGFFTTGDYNNMYYSDGMNGLLTGWQTIDDKEYYFGSDGIMFRGLTNIEGKRYYFDVDTGERYTEDGLLWIGDNACFYLLAEGGIYSGLKEVDGLLYLFSEWTGRAISGLETVGSDTYYFDESTYTAKTGFITVNNKVYYFGEDFRMVTGLKSIDGALYNFSENGSMYTGYLKDSDGSIYYFDDVSGAAVSGWYTLSTGNRYYFDPETKKAVTGWQTIDGALYCFSDTGIQKTDIIKDDIGNIYYYMSDGETASGWTDIRNNIYYFDKNTHQAKTGLTEIDNKLYYFNASGIMLTGMYELNGAIYCFGDDGSAQSGFQPYSTGYTRYFDPETLQMKTGLTEIDSQLYYFGDSGAMQTGYQCVDGVYYYFDTKTGKAMSGFVSYYINGNNYVSYADPETKQLVTGLQSIDGFLYYFRDDGIMKTGSCAIDGITYSFDPVSGKALSGFQPNEEKVYYYDSNAIRVSGLQEIDGNLYSFYASGAMQTGMATLDSLLYMFDASTGIAMSGLLVNPSTGTCYMMQEGGGVQSGSVDYWGTSYYANTSGSIRTDNRVTIDGLSNYFDENGERQLGMITYTTSTGVSQTCYFGETENVIKAADVALLQAELDAACDSDGWYNIGGLTYYVKDGSLASGIVQIGENKYGFSAKTNVLMTGLRKIGDNYYYLDENGAVVTGMVTVNNETRYFDPATGVMVTGFAVVDGSRYYFLENGVRASGTLCIDGEIYSASGPDGALIQGKNGYNETGILQKNSWMQDGENRIYLDGNGEKVTGIRSIEGGVYLFNAEGYEQTGWQTVDGNTYYFGNDGMLTGWQMIGGDTYYFNMKNGAMVTGISKIDDITYFFTEKGVKKTGFVNANGHTYCFSDSGMLYGWQTIDGNDYYFNNSGVMKIGFVTIDNNVYLFDDTGKQQFGMVSYGGNCYYLDPDTGVRQGGLVTIEGELYYFSETSGIMQTGRQKINGKTYFFDQDSGCRQLGFVTISGYSYYFVDDEVGYLTGLQEINDNVYLFSAGNGAMQTGYRWIDDIKYYFDPETGASVSGIYQNSAGDYYYFQAGGGTLVGLQEYEGKQFYFYPASGIKVDGLQSVGDKLYYFDPDEGMLKNTTIIVSGIEFVINENGEAAVSGDSDMAEMIREGMKYLGQTYASELEDDGSELVCSSFVRIMYESIGYKKLIGASYHQWYTLTHDENCEIIDSMQDAKPGDLVFYVNLACASGDDCVHWNEVHHIGMYLGEGKMMEAHCDSTGEHPELNCMMISDIVEAEHYFIFSIVRVLSE